MNCIGFCVKFNKNVHCTLLALTLKYSFADCVLSTIFLHDTFIGDISISDFIGNNIAYMCNKTQSEKKRVKILWCCRNVCCLE